MGDRCISEPYISNRDLVERLEAKAETADWDESTFYTTGAKGHTDYPTPKSLGVIYKSALIRAPFYIGQISIWNSIFKL